MSTYKLVFVVGSLRQGSYNQILAKAAAKLFPDGFEIEFVEIGDLPLFNQDKEKEANVAVQKFKQSIQKADAVVFFTPEYNRSVPGVLKNALDVGSRPYGESVWTGKPAVIGGVSTGSIGTAVAQSHLRSTLAFFNMPVMGQPELYFQYHDGMFDENHQIINEGTKKFVQNWVNSCVEWVRKMTTANSL